MADAREGSVGHPSPRIPNYPRDLLRRFASGSRSDESSAAAEEESGEIELSLGLSLGGCFGVNPKEKRGLVRSSSIAGLPLLQREKDPATIPVITRTCSLPVETEEERWKRKELQSLRRLEAKRKRSEKRSGNSRSGARDRAAAEENCRGDEDMQQDWEGPTREGKVEGEQIRGRPVLPVGSAQLAAASNGKRLVGAEVQQKQQLGWADGRLARAMDRMSCFDPMSRGSVGSQGSSSSGVSDFESQPPMQQGVDVLGLSGGSTESSSIKLMPDLTDQKAAIGPVASTAGKPLDCARAEVDGSSKKQVMGRGSGMMEMERNVMEEMPCVSTRGDGPNGRRIEGFLYKYRKGEEVRIVCVCHGNFLSPAEFVKHAGGGDVAHPLRHIVVNPSPSNLL